MYLANWPNALSKQLRFSPQGILTGMTELQVNIHLQHL